MSFPLLKDVFGQCVESFKDTIKNATLERCEVSAEERELTAWVRFSEYIKRAEIFPLF